MGFFNALANSTGWAIGQKIVHGSPDKASAKVEQERLEVEKQHLERSSEKDELDSIVNLKFGETGNEISEALNALFAKAAQLPTGIMALGDDSVKARRGAIHEKIEYGLFKLGQIDSQSLAFFQRKYDQLPGVKRK